MIDRGTWLWLELIKMCYTCVSPTKKNVTNCIIVRSVRDLIWIDFPNFFPKSENFQISYRLTIFSFVCVVRHWATFLQTQTGQFFPLSFYFCRVTSIEFENHHKKELIFPSIRLLTNNNQNQYKYIGVTVKRVIARWRQKNKNLHSHST